jgi:hypothetical protein
MHRKAHIRNMLASSFPACRHTSCRIKDSVVLAVEEETQQDKSDPLALRIVSSSFSGPRCPFWRLFNVDVPSQTAKGKRNPGLVLTCKLFIQSPSSSYIDVPARSIITKCHGC